MEEIVIYVAGNPDSYPIEYYDSQSGTYQGVIPDLLRAFSQQTNYEIRYYEPGSSDKREQLAANFQVDLISGCDGSEQFRHKEGAELVVLEAEVQGRKVQYQLWLTDTAPQTLEEELRSFFSQVSQESKAGMLVEAAGEQSGQYRRQMQGGLIGLGAAVILLAGIIAVLLRKYRASKKELRQRSERDELTGIGNIDYLERGCKALIHDQNRILYRMCYFYLDIERVERMSGRAAADELLRHTAAVLSDYISQTDLLARVSDGGFAVLRLCAGQEEMEEWISLALERIRSFSADGRAYAGQIAAGVYPLEADDYHLDEILFQAAQSAQMACQQGEDFKICTDELKRALQEERQLQEDARRGFELGEFQLYIQFYVDAKSQSIVGGEALSRWEHPERGFLAPAQFIPLMEKEGLISQLDFYLLERACAFLEQLKRAGMQDFFLSCNFSRETLSREDFAQNAREIVQKYDFEKSHLIFEITESAAFGDTLAARKNAAAIRQMGAQIALDDFGDGFTSLMDIQENALDVLKLDKALIDNLETGAGGIILRAMIKAGHELGLKVFAEGVEKAEQAQMLQEAGCDVLQGFLFHYPIPDWEAERKLKKSMQSLK